MSVDDAGRRAGASLRSQFDGMSAPPCDLSAARRPRSRRGAALVGAAVVALVAAVTVGLILARPEPKPASVPGGSWTRVSMRAAFGAHASVAQMVVGGPGFVAVGSVSSSGSVTATIRPAVWTSNDGLHWDVVDARFPSGSKFYGFASVVVHGGVFVASTELNNELWRSTDLKTWRRAARLRSHATSEIYLSVGPRGFVAVGPVPTARTASPVWTSEDGRRWSDVSGHGTVTHPVGLNLGAPLRSKWLTFDSSAALGVFTSHDGVHWTIVPGTNAPDRLGLPLASDRRRTRVLGIQFEHYEPRYSFGGRLWSTRDGESWSEIRSFHDQMPVANPDHLVQSGSWWVLGGNTGTADGLRRASMWTSPDLRHWYEMPGRLRGRESSGSAVTVIAGKGRVVGLSGSEHQSFVLVWTPPG